MKLNKFALAIALLTGCGSAIAQELPTDSTAVEIHYDYDTPPEFPAGETALMQQIAANIRYPASCIEQGIQGRVVLQYTVLADGNIGNFKVLKSAHPDLSAEAIRVVKLLPEWAPAIKNGEPVNANYVLPINFKLSDQRPKAEELPDPNPDLPEGYTKAQYPEGEKALFRFINSNLRYPVECQENDLQGRPVIVFTVHEDGHADDFKELPEAVQSHPRFVEEAIRVLKLIPEWTPAQVDGKPVESKFIIPISFLIATPDSDQRKPANSQNPCTPAQYPKGGKALMKFLGKHLRYPRECENNNIRGHVLIAFTVYDDGHADNFGPLHPDDPAHPLLIEEAIRVLKLVPHWTPAKKDDGTPVTSRLIIGINFIPESDRYVNTRDSAPTSLPRFSPDYDTHPEDRTGLRTDPTARDLWKEQNRVR